jgi:hypothetical protein
MGRPTPRELRGQLRQELLRCFDQARYFADEYHWAANAAGDKTVGDEAKVRSHAADPTGSVALDGYLERSDHDREVRGKAAIKKQMDRSHREVILALSKLSNVFDGEARKLEKAMSHLKPGPSVKNPRFEKAIVGDTTLGKLEMADTIAARERRLARGENYGG